MLYICTHVYYSNLLNYSKICQDQNMYKITLSCGDLVVLLVCFRCEKQPVWRRNYFHLFNVITTGDLIENLILIRPTVNYKTYGDFEDCMNRDARDIWGSPDVKQRTPAAWSWKNEEFPENFHKISNKQKIDQTTWFSPFSNRKHLRSPLLI